MQHIGPKRHDAAKKEKRSFDKLRTSGEYEYVAAISISRNVLARIRSEARAAHPQECCGILLGQGERIEGAQLATNVHPTPQTRFEIDPQALVDAHRAARNGGPQVLGYYHSHPKGLAEPSSTDSAMANRDGTVWAIVGRGGDVTFWRDGEEGFVPLPYSAADR